MQTTINNQLYEIYKEKDKCFNLEETESLLTDYFLPYDYILGDYSYGRLRLKGYYDEKSKKVSKINNFKDINNYIENYCAYNCNYFILKKVKKE